jgi:hypothetical protein
MNALPNRRRWRWPGLAALALIAAATTACGGGSGGSSPGASAAPSSAPVTSSQPTTAPTTSSGLKDTANPGPGETTVACWPTKCQGHSATAAESFTISFGPIYLFHGPAGATIYDVSNLSVSTSIDDSFTPALATIVDSSANQASPLQAGDNEGDTRCNLGSGYPGTQNKDEYAILAGHTITLAKGLCFGFVKGLDTNVRGLQQFFAYNISGTGVAITPSA